MKHVEEFKSYLVNDFHGCSACSLDYKTEAEVRKTSKLDRKIKWVDVFGEKKLLKTSKINTMVGANYENIVNNQREREGLEKDFEAKPLPWGHFVKENVLIEHNGNYYLRAYDHMGAAAVYNKKEYSWSDGTEVTEEEWDNLQQFFSDKKEDDNHLQGTERRIEPRPYKLDNILEVRIDKKLFD